MHNCFCRGHCEGHRARMHCWMRAAYNNSASGWTVWNQYLKPHMKCSNKLKSLKHVTSKHVDCFAREECSLPGVCISYPLLNATPRWKYKIFLNSVNVEIT